MNKIQIIIVLHVLLICVSVNAQNFTVNGSVINAETGTAVEFANIGVEGTYLGTASDINGDFELQLSHALFEKQVSVSAVGFKSKTYKVSDWHEKETLIIQLTPVNYGISEVHVAAKSKVGYGIIRAASNLIVDNYLSESYSYKCYVRTKKTNKEKTTQDETLFLMNDSKGYGKRSFTEAYQSRNYVIKESNPEKEVESLKEGLTFFDQLINQDIVRNPGNILSVESINEFDVEIVGEDVINGDSAWVISYKCKNPTINNSSDPQLSSYKGKIWISYDNNVILKNSIEAIKKNGVFKHGDSFYNPHENEEEASYIVETNYKKHKETHVLSSINYVLKDSKGKETSVYLNVVEVTPMQDSIKSRQYFNGTARNESFWDSFKRPD